ncbi:putative panthothenate kinase [Xylariaceae sp. FL0662B]|nr:putative panthothenate kinase [Xylariaceae sp. FL0662B]
MYATAALEAQEKDSRIVVGIAGVPGSGKSTIAKAIRARINELYHLKKPSAEPIAVDVPMDGFHCTRAQLAAMPDPATAIHRRGAPFTFDAEGFLKLIQKLTASPPQAVKAPAFDHAAKDPVEDAITIPTTARIVLVEGNYCALSQAPWSDAARLMTELWYIDVPTDLAHKRVAARHLESKIVATEKEAFERATGTDELNAQEIRSNRLDCDELLYLH